MSAMEPFCRLIGINPSFLSKEENILLEAELFSRICEELKIVFKEAHKDYFYLMKLTNKKEDVLLETKFAQLIINDILSTQEYNLKGIAYYTNSFEEVVEEVMLGRNTSPSATFLRRLIELHRTVRREVYEKIIKKITMQYNLTLVQ